ncbi:MAG: hypothetical protein IPH53_22295 [Flavobacteriales bacterium]|nr:hypothetical protein [Flavobacteriales bacterium]MBK9073357.1 hypothetical protein [Flavobacteriales bacterium]
MKPSVIFAVLGALAVIAVLMHRMNTLEKRLTVLANSKGAQPIAAAAPVAPEVEVAVYMGRIQSHARKLWAAGSAGNLPLAEFYRHELKEEMEAVADGNIMDGTVPVSTYMKTYGITAIDALKQQLKDDGLKDFGNRYAALISNCNSCHTATGHPYLVMQAPTSMPFDDQVFAPAH